MAIYGLHENNGSLNEFNTLEEAYDYFATNFSYKYDILWCRIAGKPSCIIGSSMAEDYEIFGGIEQYLVRFLIGGMPESEVDSTTTSLISEIRDYIYDKIEDWGIANIYYYTDTF